MASLLTGTFVLLVTYFLLGFLVALPKCILAVIILVVVFSILEEAPHDVKVSERQAELPRSRSLLTAPRPAVLLENARLDRLRSDGADVSALLVRQRRGEFRQRSCRRLLAECSLPTPADRHRRFHRPLDGALREASCHHTHQDSRSGAR